MKKKHFAALLFAAGLAVTGMTLPASAAQTNDTLTRMSEALSDTSDGTQLPGTDISTDASASTSDGSEGADESGNAKATPNSSAQKNTEKTNPADGSKDPADSGKTDPADDSGNTDPTDGSKDPTDDSKDNDDSKDKKNGVFYDSESDTWNVYQNGEAVSPFDGFQETEKGWIYITDGKYQADYTGLAEGEAMGEETLWYVSGGAIDFDYSSITNDQNGWYKIKNGKFDAGYTGISNNKNGWWRVVNGQVDFSCNSVENNENGWWKIVNGQVDFGYTGIANNRYGWWRIVNGQVDFGCNSVENNENGWWKIVNGQVDFGYTGIANNRYGWWRIVNGQVDFSCSSVENNENGWWYIRGGQVDFGFTGVAQNNYGWWYICNGQVQFNNSGSWSDGVRTYYISNGRVTSSNYYLPQTVINLPSGGYNLSTANIGLKVIKVNQAVLGNSSERYTSATASAVQNFQRLHGLYASGTVDLATWKAMGYSENDWYNLGTYRTPIKVVNGAKRDARINAMLATAAEYANARTGYKVGCSGTPGSYVDCSGLIYQCLYSAGINPSSNIVDHALAIHEYTSANLASDQWLGLPVTSYNLQAGDLIFYAKDGKNSVCHVAIYAGNGAIYDSWPGIGVSYRSMNISGYHAVKYTRVF